MEFTDILLKKFLDFKWNHFQMFLRYVPNTVESIKNRNLLEEVFCWLAKNSLNFFARFLINLFVFPTSFPAICIHFLKAME